jgi:4-oxalocrotonate tautomerase
MPFVMIDWLEGRSPEQRREIAKRITQAISEIAKVDPEAVRIFFTEHPKDHYSIGGELLSELRSRG